MKTFTTQDIRSWEPCYDQAVHLPEDWEGTALDLLAIESIPPADRLWVVLREELITAKTLRLFGVWCARQCIQTDPVCIASIDTAERYANGLASKKELAAWSGAAWDSWSSPLSNTEYAARSAAECTTHPTAWRAARFASWYFFLSAGYAVRSAQCTHLMEMLKP